MGNENKEALRKELIEEEGLKLEAYIEEISGKWHIGYGHLLQQEQTEAELAVLELGHDEYEIDEWEGFTITIEQAEQLLGVDIQDAIDSLKPKFMDEDLGKLSPARFISIMSMAYQVGGYGVQREFPSFCKAVQEEDWDRAADEMLWRNGLTKKKRSAWYTQTPDRCQEMADMMRTGTFINEEQQEEFTEELDPSKETITKEEFANLVNRVDEILDILKDSQYKPTKKPSRRS